MGEEASNNIMHHLAEDKIAAILYTDVNVTTGNAHDKLYNTISTQADYHPRHVSSISFGIDSFRQMRTL